MPLFAISNIIILISFVGIDGGKRMDYLSSAEIAKKWNVSQRRVAVFCKEGRVKGAVLIGRMWMIPKDAEKPIDSRRIMNKEEDLSDIKNDGGKENG